MQKLALNKQKEVSGGFLFYTPLVSPLLTNNFLVSILINKWFK